jgi:hypothetical protein
MTAPDWLRLGGGLTALRLADGRSLRLLTDREILEARREGLTMEGDRALNSNACLLARALVREGEPVYLSGRAVRKALSPEEIQDLAGAWAAFDRRENPGLTAPTDRVEDLKNALGGTRRIALCRELTNRNEEIMRTTLHDAIAYYQEQDPRGEYVLVLEGGEGLQKDDSLSLLTTLSPAEHVAYYEKVGMKRMDAIKAAAKDRGMTKSDLYRLLCEEK